MTLEQRRGKILAAATRLFARRGYASASMSGIAAAAGITKPVLYDHFASKDALFETLISAIRDALLAQGRAIGQSPVSAEARFQAAIDAFFAFVEERPDEARILLIIPQGNPVAEKLSRAVQQDATTGISRLLKSCLPDAPAWQLVAAGEFLKEGLHALARWWLKNPGPARADLVETVMAVCWAGFRGRKGGGGRQAAR